MKERRLEQDSGKAEIPGRRRPLEGVILEQRLALREERAGRAGSHIKSGRELSRQRGEGQRPVVGKQCEGRACSELSE